jgi:hypothetical protein
MSRANCTQLETENRLGIQSAERTINCSQGVIFRGFVDWELSNYGNRGSRHKKNVDFFDCNIEKVCLDFHPVIKAEFKLALARGSEKARAGESA